MRRRHRGVSLMEACVAITIAAITMGMAVPSFQSSLVRRSVEGVAQQLATDIQFARADAVANGRPVSLSFAEAGGASCYVMHTGARHACHCSVDGSAQCDEPAHAIKTVALPAGGRVQVRSRASGMLFDPALGTVSPTDTIRVVGADGAAIEQVVNILGRVRACSPQSSMPGYRPC